MLLRTDRAQPPVVNPMDTKSRLLEALQREAMTLDELAVRTGVSPQTVRYHLPTLMRNNAVRRVRVGRKVYLVNGGPGGHDQRRVLLKHTVLRELHAWIVRHPGRRQVDIVDAMEARGWPPSTTQHRLQRLEQTGIVHVKRKGGNVTYTAEGSL